MLGSINWTFTVCLAICLVFYMHYLNCWGGWVGNENLFLTFVFTFKGLRDRRILKAVIWTSLICSLYFFKKPFILKAMAFGGQNLEVVVNWPEVLQIPVRTGIMLDIVGKSIQPRAFGRSVGIFLCELFCWMSHHPLLRWGPVHPVCFHDMNVLGTLHRLAGLSLWAMNRLCGWWDK